MKLKIYEEGEEKFIEVSFMSFFKIWFIALSFYGISLFALVLTLGFLALKFLP